MGKKKVIADGIRTAPKTAKGCLDIMIISIESMAKIDPETRKKLGFSEDSIQKGATSFVSIYLGERNALKSAGYDIRDYDERMARATYDLGVSYIGPLEFGRNLVRSS